MAPAPSERGLEVGVQDGFPIWRLDVIGSFLKFQQHGHLKGGKRMGQWDSGQRTRSGRGSVSSSESRVRAEVVHATAPGTRRAVNVHCGAGARSGWATRATLSRGDASQHGAPVPARCSHCSGGQEAGAGQLTRGDRVPWEHGWQLPLPGGHQPAASLGVTEIPCPASSQTPLLMSSPNPSAWLPPSLLFSGANLKSIFYTGNICFQQSQNLNKNVL